MIFIPCVFLFRDYLTSPGRTTIYCKSVNDVTFISNVARFGILTAVLLIIQVSGAVMPCRLVNREFLKNRGAIIFMVKQHYQ